MMRDMFGINSSPHYSEGRYHLAKDDFAPSDTIWVERYFFGFLYLEDFDILRLFPEQDVRAIKLIVLKATLVLCVGSWRN